jgi:hypothetical protein
LRKISCRMVLFRQIRPTCQSLPVPIFGFNICPFNYGIKGDFIPELTTNTRHPKAESVQHPFFSPSNRWSLRLDPNSSRSTSSSFNPVMANQDQALHLNPIPFKNIWYYLPQIQY